jgi:hypothetical protein
MKNLGAYLLPLIILLPISAFAQTNKSAAAQAEQNAIVITFKDGHQQSIALSDVAKIEFKTSSTQASLRGERAVFTGEWKVGVGGAPGSFYITLAADGTATKSIGSQRGKWEVVGGEARISWDDGWHDVIRRAGNHFEKAAYAPGKPLTESPTNVASAARTEPM